LNSDEVRLFTDERCLDYQSAGHPERPERVGDTLRLLRAQSELPLQWAGPEAVHEESLLRAHSPKHLHHVLSTTEDFDQDTPWVPDIALHAWRAVGGAMGAMRTALSGGIGFSLMRPPGHHATRGHAMGFCYLNNVAIAALEAVAAGTERVAVFDFDVHHGNGTEAILIENPRVATFSVHQYPSYPDTGADHLGSNCFNYAVAPQTPRSEYRRVLQQALADVRCYAPKLLAVSAGFDAYARDPIAQELLEAEDFLWLGRQIRALGVPTFSVLEGGYSRELPELVLAYLKGLAGR
jgi:acetoin utilization deacetylase AcuC-like enzyme